VEYLRTVPSSVFLPKPEVDSAFVKITPRAAEEFRCDDRDLFARLVRQGFSQRRKQLHKLLREDLPDWEKAATICRFDPKARAEELSLSQWVDLANLAIPNAETEAGNSSSEPFAVVDNQDQVLGAAPRVTVHANNLLHRAVHILLFNDAGELFLQKRSHRKDRHPLVWDSSAAGHVNAGQTYEETAPRELEEELGVSAPVECLGSIPPSERTGWEHVQLYRAAHEGPFLLHPAEIETGGHVVVEPIMPEVFHLYNEYWVSYFIGSQIYDKKFIFVPDSIVDAHLIHIESLGLRGVLHE
jgi:16S rRNA (adenine1518-N6/adenine1519-N6)-dimethyltransferase